MRILALTAWNQNRPNESDTLFHIIVNHYYHVCRLFRPMVPKLFATAKRGTTAKPRLQRICRYYGHNRWIYHHEAPVAVCDSFTWQKGAYRSFYFQIITSNARASPAFPSSVFIKAESTRSVQFSSSILDARSITAMQITITRCGSWLTYCQMWVG